MQKEDILSSGKRTLQIEIDALGDLEKIINTDFYNACELLLNCRGKIVVIGMGKSGHIGRKMAATFSSTGSPAFFVHPAEAGHGDMGMISGEDVVILVSYSGKTDEVVHLIPLIKSLKVKTISITGNANSIMAKTTDVHICVTVKKEACPLDLAPTSSTTATLILGDALAIALLEARGFTAKDFAFSHPKGALGKKLLLKVSDVMHSGKDLPQVSTEATLATSLMEMTEKKLGMTTVVNAQGKLVGIFTDGDLRRWLDQGKDVHQEAIANAMISSFHTVEANALAATALGIMQKHKISALPVLNKENELVGALNMHDLLKAGMV